MADTKPTDLTERLQRAADHLAECEDQVDAAREQRNRLVVQAVEEGMSIGAVARAITKAPTTVEKIMGDPKWQELLAGN